MAIKNITRLGKQFFGFQCNIGDSKYSSGIMFQSECTDEHFDEIFPDLKSMMDWIELKINEIRSQTKVKVPPEADIVIFDDLGITSISFNFDGTTLFANLSYGLYIWSEEDNAYLDDGTYFISVIKGRKVFDVHVN